MSSVSVRNVMSRVLVVAAAAGAAMFAIVSCAPAKPEKLERPKHIPQSGRATTGSTTTKIPILVDRPPLQLTSPTPDFHDELRWPLTSMSHPVLEPKFEIASHFAAPGIGWMELCARGVQNSSGRDKELLAYLRAWCAAIKGDADAAVSNLTPLLGSTTSGLRVAVRMDLANILATGHADAASHLIKANNIRDVGVLDLLSANFTEVGTNGEAAAFNRDAIASDDYATSATKCQRLTKAIVLSGNKMSELILEVEALATKPKLPDATCVRMHHKLQCWREQRHCRGFYEDEGLNIALVNLTDAYYSWPNDRSSRHWLDIADKALNATSLPGGRELTFAALENAVRAEPCAPSTKDWMTLRTQSFRALLDTAEQARLDAIIAGCK